MDKIEAKFKAILQDLTTGEIEEFFETHFLKPSLIQLDGGKEIPAEEIRQQRHTINKIKRKFLTLRTE